MDGAYSCYYARNLNDGRRIEVWPLTFGRARLAVLDGWDVLTGY